MASAQKEKNGTFTGRARKEPALKESKSGFATKTDALKWARKREDDYVEARGERGLGPNRTPVADALLQNGLETLPFKKGAVQEANRINVALRLTGRPTLRVTPCAAPVGRNAAETFEKRKAQIKFFDVVQVEPGAVRRVVPSLAEHRAEQEYMSDECRKVLTRLANKYVGDVTSADLNDLVTARGMDGKGASTLRHDVHIFRSMLNRVRRAWKWTSVVRVRNDEIDFPKLPEGRKITCTPKQETKLPAAMAGSYQPKAVAATAMLIETAMRFSECMDTARWCDFDREACLIRLSQAKAGARDVPLNENAMAVLLAMKHGEPNEPIFGFSYESYKKNLRACLRESRYRGLEGA